MAVANKIYSQGSRVLQKIKVNSLIFNDPDITLSFDINLQDRTKTGDLTIRFDTSLNFIAGNYNIGDNFKYIKKVENSTFLSKSTKINDDNNGPGNGSNWEVITNNYIFIPRNQIQNIKKITFDAAQGVGSLNIKLNSLFPNLTSLLLNLQIAPDFSFLTSIPEIKILEFNSNVSQWLNLSALKSSNLIALIVKGYNFKIQETITQSFPPSLYYLKMSTQIMNHDLADYFTGKLIGFVIATASTNKNITYRGGAVFPSVIADTPEFPIDYIFYSANLNSSYIDKQLPPDQFSQFIIDFANQVIAVNLQNTSAKKIKVVGGSANTSYTDNSQPLFKTYASALNHITSTLGITVTFTEHENNN